MSYQLPADTSLVLKDNKSIRDNYGLWLNKAGRWKRDRKQKGKGKFLYPFEGSTQKTYQEGDTIKELREAAVERQSEAVNQLDLELQKVEMKNIWRMVVGLGNASVYETGMTLHPIYGFPYIPASAVKGVIRSWIITECFEKDENLALKSDLFVHIFGSDTRGGDSKARKGGAVFFDALPVDKICLEPDVMTPHYGEYYTDGKPPADYLTPSPIHFLTVRNTSFRFWFGLSKKDIYKSLSNFDHDALQEKSPGESDSRSDTSLLTFISGWLIDALENHGIGSKTAVGYGRMREK